MIICLVAGLFLSAKAQMSVTPHVGYSMPQGASSNFAGNGLSYGLALEYEVVENFKIGAAFSQHNFDGQIAGFNLNILDFRVTPITATAKYILPGNTLRPFFGLEGGLYNFSVGAAGFDIERQYWGLAPSLGVLYPINANIDFFASAQYHMMNLDENIPVADFNISQDIRFIPVNLGVTFKF